MLKFIGWIFSGTTRHWQGIRTYEKGWGGRIWTLIFSIILLGLSFAAEFWFFNYISNINVDTKLPIFSLILISALAIGLVGYTIDHCAIFSYVAFKNAFFGVIMTAARLRDQKNRKKKASLAQASIDKSQLAESTIESDVNNANTNKKESNYKIFDIITGFVMACIAIVALASAVIVFVNFIK